MGELFRRRRPDSTLAWTGERLVSEVGGEIESEHLHRYFLARELCRGKVVLDVASGEGYGTALLAQTAQQVTGVEIDAESVLHACRAYQSPNLAFLQGSATALPLEAASVDIVVSFETLEHFFDHDLFLREAQRVLRPGGVLVISTPDAEVYSRAGATANPFHVRELTRAEFIERLQTTFCNVALFHQRVIHGSAIVSDAQNAAPGERWIYEHRGSDTYEGHRDLPHAPYLVAIASNSPPPPLVDLSLYLNEQVDEAGELDRLRQLEAAYREQEPKLHAELEIGAAAREELARVTPLLSQLQQEVTGLEQTVAAYREQEPKLHAELEIGAAAREELAQVTLLLSQLQQEVTGLQQTVAAYREQEPKLHAELETGAAAREELARLTILLSQLQQEVAGLHQTAAEQRAQESNIHEQLESETAVELGRLTAERDRLSRALDEATDDLCNRQQQIDNNTSRLREQTLVMARLQHQMTIEIQTVHKLRTLNDQQEAYSRSQLEQIQEMETRFERQEASSRSQLEQFREIKTRFERQAQELNRMTLEVRQWKTASDQQEAAYQDSERRCRTLNHELAAARSEAERYRLLCNNLASLIVPVWVRKLVPPGLRPAMRSLKRIVSYGRSQ